MDYIPWFDVIYTGSSTADHLRRIFQAMVTNSFSLNSPFQNPWVKLIQRVDGLRSPYDLEFGQNAPFAPIEAVVAGLPHFKIGRVDEEILHFVTDPGKDEMIVAGFQYRGDIERGRDGIGVFMLLIADFADGPVDQPIHWEFFWKRGLSFMPGRALTIAEVLREWAPDPSLPFST